MKTLENQDTGNILRFSNGTTAPFRYDASIDLEEIAELTYGQVLDDIEKSLSEPLNADHELQAVYIDIPRADQKYGIDSGHNRFRPVDFEEKRDFFCIATDTGKASTSADFPVLHEEEEAERIIRPVMGNEGLVFDSVYFNESDGTPYCDVDFWVPPEMPLTQVAETCQLIIALLIGAKPVPDSPLSAYQALTTGKWDALLNLVESEWFEAKQSMYGLAAVQQCHELALDVASFANGDQGGLIVIGLKTSKDKYGQDIVSATDGISRLNVSVARLEDILHQRIHPLPSSLSVTVVQRENRELLAILIPPQGTDAKPFLVSGATIDDEKVYGGGFTWVERKGASKRIVSIANIQALLRSGLLGI